MAERRTSEALLMALVANGTIVRYALILATAIIMREYLGPLNIVLPVSKLAKWKTTSQLVALAMLLLAFIETPLPIWTAGLLVLWLAAGLSVWTGWEYMRSSWKSWQRHNLQFLIIL